MKVKRIWLYDRTERVEYAVPISHILNSDKEDKLVVEADSILILVSINKSMLNKINHKKNKYILLIFTFFCRFYFYL